MDASGRGDAARQGPRILSPWDAEDVALEKAGLTRRSVLLGALGLSVFRKKIWQVGVRLASPAEVAAVNGWNGGMDLASLHALIKERYSVILAEMRLDSELLVNTIRFEKTEMLGGRMHVPVVLSNPAGWTSPDFGAYNDDAED